MKKRQILNIVNFIRAVEPRLEMDLVEPVRQQIRLAREHGLKCTFLLQYDALVDPTLRSLVEGLDPEQFEIGVWLEIVQQQSERAGIAWRGRYPWDWHAHCGFSVGYTADERRRLCDLLFEEFRNHFGVYPKSMGSWIYDAVTLVHASDSYGLDAGCICKEQWGTDGYLLWGGYYGQAYYPSRSNIYSPAQSAATQIDVPLFRMLGSDPIYQYDVGLDLDKGPTNSQGVITLEPVYGSCGASESWVDWFMRENFNGKCLSFGYAQAGQENSFGWAAMKAGLEMQFEKITKLAKSGAIEVETLGESGRWYKRTFAQTPASAIVAQTDWKGEGRQSFWYSSRNYRVNLFLDGGNFWFRDLHVFRDSYMERYRDSPCTEDYLMFDTLPVMDGNLFSGGGVRAGIYPVAADGTALSAASAEWTEPDGNGNVRFRGTQCGDFTVSFEEGRITCKAESGEFRLELRFGPDNGPMPQPAVLAGSGNSVTMLHNGYEYSIAIVEGRFEGAFESIISEHGRIAITCA